MDDLALTLGGRRLTGRDLFWLGVLVAAVDGCRSIEADSTVELIGLRGVPNFAQTVLAVEHFRRRRGAEPSGAGG